MKYPTTRCKHSVCCSHMRTGTLCCVATTFNSDTSIRQQWKAHHQPPPMSRLQRSDDPIQSAYTPGLGASIDAGATAQAIQAKEGVKAKEGVEDSVGVQVQVQVKIQVEDGVTQKQANEDKVNTNAVLEIRTSTGISIDVGTRSSTSTGTRTSTSPAQPTPFQCKGVHVHLQQQSGGVWERGHQHAHAKCRCLSPTRHEEHLHWSQRSVEHGYVHVD